MIDSVINAFFRNEPMKAKDFASVLGTINAGYKALGPISRILLRSSYSQLSSLVQPLDPSTGIFVPPNWKVNIRITDKIVRELSLLKSQLSIINGQPITSVKTGITLDKILRKVSNEVNQAITHPDVIAVQPSSSTFKAQTSNFPPCHKGMDMKVFASDSSDTTEFAFNVECPDQTFEAFMSTETQQTSSGHRELKSVLDCVLNHPNYFSSDLPLKVYWLTDSQNLYYWLRQGSKQPTVQADIFQL